MPPEMRTVEPGRWPDLLAANLAHLRDCYDESGHSPYSLAETSEGRLSHMTIRRAFGLGAERQRPVTWEVLCALASALGAELIVEGEVEGFLEGVVSELAEKYALRGDGPDLLRTIARRMTGMSRAERRGLRRMMGLLPAKANSAETEEEHHEQEGTGD